MTEPAGVACHAYGLGVVVGDYNRDGWPDLYLNNFGPNVLYRNNGDGIVHRRHRRRGRHAGRRSSVRGPRSSISKATATSICTWATTSPWT